MQLDIKTNKKELIIDNYLANKHLENISENHFQLSIKKFMLFEQFTKSKLKFSITKNSLFFIYCWFFLIFGFLIFFQNIEIATQT